MAFKKLDSDAVSSSDGRALDAFVLQGEAANYAQADEDRGRSIGQAYTAERGTGTDTRPVLASPASWGSCAPLGAFPVSPRCRQLTVQIRGVATAATGKTDAVKLRLLLMKVDGSIVEEETLVTVAGSASAQTIDLTIATDEVQGEVVVAWVYFVSVPSAVLTTGTHAGDDVTEAGALLQLNHLSFTFDATKRYAVSFDEDAAGAVPRDSQGYPGESMVNGEKATHHYRVIPALPAYMADHSLAFDVSLVELGRFEVYGWSLTETSFQSLPSLDPKTRPGGRLRARTGQELYRRGYHLTTRRTRLFSCGSSTAQLVLGSSNQVNMDGWSTRAIAGLIDDTRDIYVSLIGALPTFQVQASSATPATEYRRRYRVLALYALATSGTQAGGNLRTRCEVAINSFGGGPSWGASAVTPSETGGQTQTAPSTVYQRGEVSSMSLVAAPALELAYRWWAHSDLLAGRSGLRMLDFQFEEDAGQTTVLERLIRLRFNVQIADTGAPPRQTSAVFPGATIMIDEGF